MGSRARALGIVVAASAMAFGCNLLTGASDLSIARDNAGDGGAGESGSPRGDGGKLSATCVAAGGYAGLCLFDKEGWKPIVLPLAGGACPPDYRTMETLAAADTTNDACTCTCTAKVGSCDGPLALFTSGNSGTACTVGPTTVPFPPDGGCLAIPNSLDFPRVRMSLAGQAPTDCTAVTKESFGPIVSLPACTGAAATAAPECEGTGCYPAPPPGAKVCIVHEGERSCPRDFAIRILAGRDAEDNRACGDCTCIDEGCKDAKVQQYLDEKCTLPVGNLPLDDCRPQSPGLPVRGASYKPPSACRAVNPAGGGVTGTVTFENQRTICCAP